MSERPYGRLVRPPERSQRPTLDALRAAGFPFEKLGHWTKFGCVLSVTAVPGVYIWVIDGVAVYVGDSRSVSLRQAHHAKSVKDRPSRELHAALARGKRVTVYWIRDPIARWNGMDLPVRRSVEHRLLWNWVFAWNSTDQGRLSSQAR